jgi:hypothetical protein
MLTIDNLLLVTTLSSLVSLPNQLIDLVLELGLERANLLEHDTELDEGCDDLGSLGGGERSGLELECEDGDHLMKVREEEVILE